MRKQAWIAAQVSVTSAAFLAACGEDPTPQKSPASLGVAVSSARSCFAADTSIGEGGVRGDSALFAKTGLNWSTASHYGRYLRTMREPALCSDAGVERYRFLWLPSFQRAIAVRVDRRSNATNLTVKEVTGADYDRSGALSRDTVIRLSPAEWEQFERLLDATDLWDVPRKEQHPADSGALDGAQAVFEAAVPDRYHLVERSSPHSELVPEPFQQLGAYLLKLARYDARLDLAR